MKRMIAILCCVMFLAITCFSQTTKKDTLKNGIPVHISYFSDLYTHPGFKIGVEHVLRTRVKEKEKRGKIKFKEKQLLITGSLGMYYHGEYHTGLLGMAEFARRRINKNGCYIDLTIGSGYLRTVLPGTTYEVDENDQVREVAFAGSNIYIQSIAVTFGKSFLKTRDFPFSWYLKQNVLFLIPYNSGFGMIWAPELGISYRIGRKKNKNE